VPLPASTVGLLLAAPAATKALNPLAAPVLHAPQPQLAGAGYAQLGRSAPPAAVAVAAQVADGTASAEPAFNNRVQ